MSRERSDILRDNNIESDTHMFSMLRQSVRLSRRLPQYARTFTNGNGSQIEDEARGFIGVGHDSSPQVEREVPPAPPTVQAAPPSLDDMHHHLPPERHPILQLIATYIMSKKVRKKPKDVNEPYNKPRLELPN